jgi:hypothetical protein
MIVSNSTPAGSWFLEADGARLELAISVIHNKFTGMITHEDGYSEIISDISWDPYACALEFWWGSVREWCRAYVMDEASPYPAAPARPNAPPVETAAPEPRRPDAAQQAYDANLYELAAALAPVFAGPQPEPGATGAHFGKLLFSIPEVGPCCRLDSNMRPWGHEASQDKAFQEASHTGRRCA